MKSCFVVIFTVVALVSGEAPPLPYATTQSQAYSNDHLQTVGAQYVDGYVQPGYEGYILPGGDHGIYSLVDGLDLKSHAFLPKIIKSVFALAIKVVPKIAIGAVVVLALFLIGGCVNALICTLTPLCTISFLGVGVTRDTMRSYLTPDKISSTASFIADSIRKYKDMYETLTNEVDTSKKSIKK